MLLYSDLPARLDLVALDLTTIMSESLQVRLYASKLCYTDQLQSLRHNGC